MADVLKVIQDVLKMDAQQKREEKKIMREVQKKLKEKEVSEDDGTGDGDEYQKFVQTMLKKFGVKSPSELKGDKKKEFYDALDAGWEGDDEKPEPGDKEKDESLGDRVQARMKAEQEDEEEDEDEDPVGDGKSDAKAAEKEPEPEPDEEEPDPDEVEGEKLDKLADLVIQKLKDKQSEEEDEEEEPEPTEAEGGKTEKIDTKPKVEGLNPHRKSVWEEALRKVHEEKVPAPIPTIIKSVGKQLMDYAKERGGIDRGDFMTVAKVMLQGKIPKASIIPSDTDPREFVHDLMAKTFGWKFVEQEYGITFTRRRDYVESFQGGHKLQEHCGECGLGLEEASYKEGEKIDPKLVVWTSKDKKFVVCDKGEKKGQDRFHMYEVKGNVVTKNWGSHPSLNGAKKFAANKGFKEEVEEAKKMKKGLTDIPPDEEDDDMTASGMSKKDADKLRKKK